MEFHSLTPEFDWEKALTCANASKLVYEDGAVVTDYLKHSWGYDYCKFIDVGKTQAFIGRKKSNLLISFRGTKGAGDWIANLELSKTGTNYGRVHTGFLKAYKVVESQIMEEVLTTPDHHVLITGHSLGGAIATIAAAEISDKGHGDKINGIYTFGQPRTGNSKFKKFINSVFYQRHIRFVYDDDIVTRIPPIFKHCGQLYHFDKHGILKPIEPLKLPNLDMDMVEDESEEVTSEEPSLTEDEFQKLKAEIRTLEGVIGYTGSNEAEDEELDMMVEGIIPSISDHSMSNYVNAVRRIAKKPKPNTIFEAFSARPEAILRGGGGSKRLTQIGVPNEAYEEDADFTEEVMVEDSDDLNEDFTFETEADVAVEGQPVMIAALVRLITPDWTPPNDIIVNSTVGVIASIKGTIGAIENLEKDKSIVSIEYSRDAGIEELGDSLPLISGDQVHRPTINERGDMAIVGVVDTGIDILHEAFLDSNGQTRIIGFWHQKGALKKTPHSVDPVFSQNYGDLYTHAEIQGFIDQARIYGDRVVPSILRDRSSGHGTHVTSIAAGRAVGPLSSGIAPEAKIIVVKPDMRSMPGSPYSLGYSSSHVDALHFLKIAALGGNAISASRLPLAINVSLGMNAGAHDGSSLLEAGFDGITGNGRDPGIAIVKSAGNERGRKGHATLTPAAGLQEFEWLSKDEDRLKDYFEVWYRSLDEMEFVLIDPAGNRSPRVTASNNSVTVVLGGNKCVLKLTSYHPDNGDNQLSILIYDQVNEIQRDYWKLEVHGIQINSANETIDIWVERNNARAVEFSFSEHHRTLSIPGTAKHVICVGATTKANPPGLYRRSSYGPTRTAAKKPEISAPGSGIKAAKSGTSDHQAVTVKNGTSMAAPHIAGLLALAFSKREKQPAKPQLNSNQLKSALIKNVYNLNGFNPGFGFGLIDAKKFMDNLP